MPYKLLVNPDSAQPWEILLKDGINRIGRLEDNDHQINHPSVSSAHCELIVRDGTVVLKDLGSTNGTFINRTPVLEADLHSGQRVQFGNVEALFESVEAAQPIPLPPPVGRPGGPLRINRANSETIPQVAAVAVADEQIPLPPAIAPIRVSTAFCKSHPKSPARYHCDRCRQYFCEICVTSRATAAATGKFCRKCGSAVAPVEVKHTHAPPKGFFEQLPAAFAYPVNGDGMILLFSGALFYLLIDSMRALARFGGMFALGGGGLLAVFGTGYLVSYLRRIVMDSANGEDRMPDWPEFTDWSDVSTPASQFFFTILLSFSPAIGLVIWSVFDAPEWATLLIIPALIFGCVYFPMAFLGVAMFDTIGAVNPMLIVPSIIRVPLHYLVACGLLVTIVAIYWITKFILAMMIPIPILPTAVAGFVNLYLLSVEMRILGLLYLTNKRKLGWFNR